jgi:hypothetical protein
MTQTMHATFDGQVLRPDETVELDANTRVWITIETADPPASKTASFLQTAQSLALEGPPDWSARLEYYLYDRAPNDSAPNDSG